MAEPWNVNIHYDGKLDERVQQGAASVLDVGCGDGFLAARLAQRIPNVVAVDIDQPALARAKQRFPAAPVNWRSGDILAIADELGDFDAVVSNATLHHLPDTAAALACLRGLVRPGGTLALVTFARPRHGRRASPSPSYGDMSAANYPVRGFRCFRWGASSSSGLRPRRAGDPSASASRGPLAAH